MDIPNPTPVSVPPPVIPNTVFPVQKKSNLRLWLMIGILLIVALIALGWFLGPLKLMAQNFQGALALHGAEVVTVDQEGNVQASHVGIFGLKHLSSGKVSGTVTAQVESSDRSVAIVQAVGGGQDVFLLADEPVRLTTNGGDKRGLVSHGDLIAFTEFHPTDPTHIPGESDTLAEWTVQVVNPTTQEMHTYPGASDPVFFERNGVAHLGMVTTQGVRFVSLDTFDAQDIAMNGVGDAAHRFVIAADGSRAALYSAVSHQYVLYRISDTNTVLVLEPETILADTIDVVALTAEGVYTKIQEGGAATIAYSSDAVHSEWTYTIPGTTLYSLIP